MNGRMKPRVGRLLNDARFSFAPTGGEDVLRQGLLMLAMYAAYDVSRALVVGREDTAMANGLFFLNLEKAMHIYIEPWVQSHISSIPGAMAFMVWAYGALHLPLIIGLMTWVFLQRRSQWKLIRNWFLGMNFMALLLYFLLPTAPPRMIFTAGIVDMSYMYGKRPAIYENGILANPFAAMPSLHFAYALLIALVVFMLARQKWLRWGGFLYPALVLARAGLTADMLTLFGLLLHVGAVPLILTGHFVWAAVVMIVAAVCDALDGAVARAGVGPSRAGAFLDSTTDRISELLVAGALAVYWGGQGHWWTTFATLLFMGASQLVSYTRARAEALGVECKVGLMSRPERIVVLVVGFVFSGWSVGDQSVLVYVLWILAVLTSLTVVQRMLHVMRKLRRADAA